MKLRTKNTFSTHSFQAGVTMIEALVAMLVFSVGALGLVAMQFSSMSSGMDNQQRTLAIWKAQEFASRIKSNPQGLQNYIDIINNEVVSRLPGDLGVNTTDKGGMVECGSGVFAGGVKRCSSYINDDNVLVKAENCTVAELAAFDVWDVFCEPTTGASPEATTNATVVNGAAGLSQLQVFLSREFLDLNNDGLDDGSGDVELFFEWLSKGGENAKGISNTDAATGVAGATNTVLTSLCGFTDERPVGADSRVAMDSRLDAYCLKFRI